MHLLKLIVILKLIYSNFTILNILNIYMVFTTERLFEVAIESWLEWDLNP